MTVREWFRLLRLGDTVRRLHDPEADFQARYQLVDAVRAGDWRRAEFWMLAQLSEIQHGVRQDAQRSTYGGQHVWVLDTTRYLWQCAHCPASVPSVEIDEEGPSRRFFEAGCECPACQPCRGGHHATA